MRILFAVVSIGTFLLIPSLLAQVGARGGKHDKKIEERVEGIIARMTLEEKITLLGGVDDFFTRPVPRLGIPKLKMSDGPLGVVDYGEATAFPAGISMAATWNPDLVKKVGEAVGIEARSKGVHIMLSPGVNIYRAPMCGRNFEYYGEDPFLAGTMATAYIQGVQSMGVVATVKHFACNNQEWDRHNVSSNLDEQTLREIYLPAFEMAVKDGRVGAVMTSYNLVNGVHCSQDRHLITDILKGEWKFDGLVMSDWGSTYDGVAAALGGLDLEMPSAAHMTIDTLIPAVQSGRIPVTVIDDKIRRLLDLMFRFGFMNHDQTDSTLPLFNPDSRLIALLAAREGIVLLKNDHHLLPFNRSRIRSIAVLGPDAHPAVTGGGGSSQVQPYRAVSILDGLIRFAGDQIRVFYDQGINMWKDDIFSQSEFSPDNPGTDTGKSKTGLTGEYFANADLSGSPLFVRLDEHVHFDWGAGSPAASIPADSFSIRWSGTMKAPVSGRYEFMIRANNGFRLWVDGKSVIDFWENPGVATKGATVDLTNDKPHKVRLEYCERTGTAEVHLGWRMAQDPVRSEARKLARLSDAVVVCVGFNPQTETEGADRTFALPPEQELLIQEAARNNNNTVVVLTCGGNVEMLRWIDSVRGLIHCWYPGQEGGTAVGEIILGITNPSGKLPASFEKRWEDNAAFNSYYDNNKDKKVEYSEGIFLGYRHFDKEKIEPLFPFGFGLSYTQFAYSHLQIKQEPTGGGQNVKVVFKVKNTGNREGAEIAQLYIHNPVTRVARPVKELKGFAKINLKAGESRSVAIMLDDRAFSFFDTTKNTWTIEPGKFEILVGASSRDIRLNGTVDIRK